MSCTIHPTAIVSSGAELGENVTVGPYAFIEDNVIIGDNSTVQPFASVLQYTEMGKGNTIHSYALVGGIPQDLKFKGEVSKLIMGDNNNIREYATVHRGTEGGGGFTRLGNNNLIMSHCHIAHDCILGNNVIMSSHAGLAGHVQLDDFVIVGGLSGIHQFVRIGAHAFIGAVTGIGMDLPPYMLAVGNRAGVGGPNIVGLRRLGAVSSTVTALRQVYRLIWLSGTPRQEALARVEVDFADVPEVHEIVEFIRGSVRGVLAAQRGNMQE